MRNCYFITLIALFLFVSCGEKRTNPIIQNLDKSWTVTTDTLNIKMQVDVPSVIQADMYENGLGVTQSYKEAKRLFELADKLEEIRDAISDGLPKDELRKLVFVWKNDGSGGNQQGAIIDNIMIEPVGEEITCIKPVETSVVASEITASSATIS